MKKLKTWQIVLLVIFYPIGICVWIYRVWKKNKLKRDAATAAVARREAKEREDAARLEAWRAERAARETLKFKVVGVTFKNEDGKSRQTLLRKLHFGDAPFNSDGGVDITIERGAYQGEPAFSVFAEGHQVGNISKDDVPFFVRRWSDFVGVTSAEVYGGGTDDEGHSINYRKAKLHFLLSGMPFLQLSPDLCRPCTRRLYPCPRPLRRPADRCPYP